MAFVVAVAELDVVAGVGDREKERKGRTSDVQARVLVVRFLSGGKGAFLLFTAHFWLLVLRVLTLLLNSSELATLLNHDKKCLQEQRS